MMPLSTPLPGPATCGGLQALAGHADLVAHTLAGAGGDLVLVLDAQGLILDAIAGDNSTARVAQACPGWRGQAWIDTVAPDSRGKVQRMLDELAQSGRARRREINARDGAGGSAGALDCRGIRLGPQGPSLVVGRDLDAQARLQQRFLEAQGQLEAGEWRRRHPMSDY